MLRLVLVAGVVAAGAGLVASAGQPAAVSPHAAAPAPAISVSATATASSLLDAFGRHRIVALGLAHNLRQEDDFVLDLLRHPRFAKTVNSIVVEFGNARYQARADRYVAGGAVSARMLRPVWRDTIGAAPDGVVDEAAAPFFAAVRALNRTLSPARRIRVALGDPAFDFRTLHRRQDIYKAGARRDRVFAAAAERAARGGHNVLLLSGFMHFARVAPELFGDDNAVQILERRARNRVWVVLPYWGGGARGQEDFAQHFIRHWPRVALRPLTGALGGVPADRILPDLPAPQHGAKPRAQPYPGLELQAVGDALISFGPCSRLRSTRFSRAQFRDPAYRAELDRRSRILIGRSFVAPPVQLSDAPYCPIVARQ